MVYEAAGYDRESNRLVKEVKLPEWLWPDNAADSETIRFGLIVATIPLAIVTAWAAVRGRMGLVLVAGFFVWSLPLLYPPYHALIFSPPYNDLWLSP